MRPIRNDTGYTEMQKNWSCTQSSIWPLEPCLHVWAVSQLRSLLEMQNLRPYSKPRNQDLHFNKIPRDARAHSSSRNTHLVDIILLVLSQ